MFFVSAASQRYSLGKSAASILARRSLNVPSQPTTPCPRPLSLLPHSTDLVMPSHFRRVARYSLIQSREFACIILWTQTASAVCFLWKTFKTRSDKSRSEHAAWPPTSTDRDGRGGGGDDCSGKKEGWGMEYQHFIRSRLRSLAF